MASLNGPAKLVRMTNEARVTKDGVDIRSVSFGRDVSVSAVAKGRSDASSAHGVS